MKLIKGFFVVIIAAFLLFNIDRNSDNRLAAAPEEVISISDHSQCDAKIAQQEAENQLLQEELAQARQSFELTLQIELEFIPGFFGEWAVMSFSSIPIEISACAAEGLSVGDNLCSNTGSLAVECRIIVADISPSI